MNQWSKVNQWLYPPECRIVAGTAEWVATSVAAVPAREVVPPPAAAGLERAFVLDLCNNFHRLNRSAKPFQDTNTADAARMNRNLEQLRRVLHDNGIECVDLSGQVYDPGRADFEPLGEPQPTAGLTRTTIIQCERPLVMLKGKLIQPAKGIVGRPAAG